MRVTTYVLKQNEQKLSLIITKYSFLHVLFRVVYMSCVLLHTCQVLGKSKSEIARAPLIFVYNLVIERAEKSGAQV